MSGSSIALNNLRVVVILVVLAFQSVLALLRLAAAKTVCGHARNESTPWAASWVLVDVSMGQNSSKLPGPAVEGLSGARDEFHLAAIVQNLKTLALQLFGPPSHGAYASTA